MTRHTRLDDCLSTRGGQLWIEECGTLDLLREFGSPLFVLSNFNAMPRPATVLVTGDRAAVIRRRETEQDVLRRDVIPEHLKDEPLNVER